MEVLVNNVKLYYEEYGVGKPIILLHGNQETHEILDKLIDRLKTNYKVYAIDSRCYSFSDGGIIGLLIAIKEPMLLSKLIISGANTTPDILSIPFKLFTNLIYFFTRSKYIKMMLNEPNIKTEELKNIRIPVYVLAGEKDIVKYEHTKYIDDNIENSTLEIIKKENHGSYIVNNEKIYEIIKNYLN